MRAKGGPRCYRDMSFLEQTLGDISGSVAGGDTGPDIEAGPWDVRMHADLV
jgi:hypothetical protein